MQGRLRGEAVAVTVETACAHCGQRLSVELDSELGIRGLEPGCGPMVFVPDVNLSKLKAPNIIDDF